jgi:hypothetical protein
MRLLEGTALDKQGKRNPIYDAFTGERFNRSVNVLVVPHTLQ